jgi:hypothetical protein
VHNIADAVGTAVLCSVRCLPTPVPLTVALRMLLIAHPAECSKGARSTGTFAGLTHGADVSSPVACAQMHACLAISRVFCPFRYWSVYCVIALGLRGLFLWTGCAKAAVQQPTVLLLASTCQALAAQVGVVGLDCKFRLLSPSEVEAHLRTVQ